MVWVVYNGVGIAKHGFFGYLKPPRCPPGVPVFMWPLIIPLEFFSNIIVRPITLSLRLFANMFAGHLLVLVFVLGGEYLLLHSESIINKTAGVVALIFSMAIFGLEIFVQSLQAFIFTVLTAQYIASASPRSTDHPRFRQPAAKPRQRKQSMTPLELTGSLGIVGYGLGAIGPGIGVGLIFASVIQGTARQPEARGAMMGTAWIGFAVTEALAIIGIALAFVFGGS